MFLHLSVSQFTGGSTWTGTPLPGRYTPPGRYPNFPAGTPSAWAGTHPPGQVHPSPAGIHPRAGTPLISRYTPLGQVHAPLAGTPPPAVHAGRYGKQAGGTHPTGMHSCASCCYLTLSKYVHEQQVQRNPTNRTDHHCWSAIENV